MGGWHDSGDYGKYSTNNAYTVGILPQAYEQCDGRNLQGRPVAAGIYIAGLRAGSSTVSCKIVLAR